MLLISDYYFLDTALPPIRIGEPVEMSYEEFRILLDANLSGYEMKKVRTIRRFHNIQNMRYYWMGEELDRYGNYDPQDLEEALITGIALPDYIFEFLEQYEDKEDRIRYYPKLLSEYFSKECERAKGFLKDYLTLEREIRLVLTALRAKDLGRDITKELQFEDSDDTLIAQILAQKDAKTYEPPERYQGLKSIYETNKDHPHALYQALAEFRFYSIDEMLGVQFFTIDRILGYMIQLILAEKWLELDQQKGLTIIESIVKEAS